MGKSTRVVITLFALVTFIFSSCKKDHPGSCDCDQQDLVATTSVYASGLNNPRGLKFGPDGNLYVAEGGIGGNDSTIGSCTQVLPDIGPYHGSTSGARIISIVNGTVMTVADSLPSSQTQPAPAPLISGVGDIAFIGNDLYAVLAGAGCSHGVAGIPNGVVKVASDKTWDVIANLSEWQMNNPVAKPADADFEPDGTWYSIINHDGNLYAVEPNHGELVKVTPDGTISRVVDISASFGHIVPTALTFHDGNFYVGNLNTFPIKGNSSVYKITPDGSIEEVATGFSAITGLAFDKSGAMYVLENTTANDFPTPGTGDIIQIDRSGNRKALVTGLNLPTAMTFGPDNNLYVSNWGFGPPAIGGGEIVKVTISCKTKDMGKN